MKIHGSSGSNGTSRSRCADPKKKRVLGHSGHGPVVAHAGVQPDDVPLDGRGTELGTTDSIATH